MVHGKRCHVHNLTSTLGISNQHNINVGMPYMLQGNPSRLDHLCPMISYDNLPSWYQAVGKQAHQSCNNALSGASSLSCHVIFDWIIIKLHIVCSPYTTLTITHGCIGKTYAPFCDHDVQNWTVLEKVDVSIPRLLTGILCHHSFLVAGMHGDGSLSRVGRVDTTLNPGASRECDACIANIPRHGT
eukprot:351002-Chlamydomonas_euryale.AAC.4